MQNWTRVAGIGRAEPQYIEGGPWDKNRLAFVAFDSAKEKHAVAIADDGRDGELRYLGEIDNSPDAVRKLVTELSRQYERLHFC
jgi:transposase